MADLNETVIMTKTGEEKLSSIFGVSIRGWIAILLTATVCGNQIFLTAACVWDAIANKDFSKVGTFTTIGEPLYSMGVAALGFYFGQKNSKT
jgi:hypothetical protein